MREERTREKRKETLNTVAIYTSIQLYDAIQTCTTSQYILFDQHILLYNMVSRTESVHKSRSYPSKQNKTLQPHNMLVTKSSPLTTGHHIEVSSVMKGLGER